MQTNAAAAAGRLGVSGNSAGGARSNVSTAPPRPLRPRQTVHPLALVDPQALSPNKRAAQSAASAPVSSAAPPPPPLPRRVQQSPASTAAATSAAVHSTAAASTFSAPASSASATTSVATRIAAKSTSGRSNNSGSSSGGGGSGGNGWSARAAELAAPVVQHWRLLTRSRLVQLSLDQRVADFQSRRAVRLWSALRQQSKERWKASVARRTVAAYAFLKHAFVRFRAACTAPDRPSVQLAASALLQCRAVEFFTFKRRTRALQRWKRVYAQGVLLQDQADQVAVVRATHLARAALDSWKARLARLHSADQSAHTLAQLQAQRLRRDAWMQWRSSQASSALERVGSGVARKHAYRSALQRAMRAWKRAVGAGLELDRVARLQLQRQRVRLLWSYWIAWHQGVHRLRVLGAVVERRAAVLAAEAKRDTLRQWRDAMLSLRHTSRLMHIASRFRVRVLRRRALYLWTESLRLTRVRRLMGASAFELLRRKWSRWRAALAAQRAQTKRDRQASLHRQWRQLAVSVANWKSFVVANQTGRLLDERADAFLLQRTGSRLLRRWAQRARASKVALVHRAAATQFRQSHLLQFGLRRLRSIIDSAHAQGSHRRLVRLFQRRCAFTVWRSFSNSSVAQYENARRARRFAYLRKLRGAFLGWRRQRDRERGLEQRLEARTRPLLLRAQHVLFRHWSTLAASSRSFHRKMAAAQQLDRTNLLQSCFALWRDRFQHLCVERQHARMAERHARLRLLAGMMYAWDAYAYQQRHVRRNIHEQVQLLRRQLDQARRRRLFDAWRDRLARHLLHQQQRQQAVLHHARCVLFRSYRAWQTNFARRLVTHQKLAALSRRVELRSERRLWSLWRQSLAARRRALHKHVQSLRFWARRVMRRAWAGWAKYHRLQRLKDSMMQQALEHRQAKLRRVAVGQWVVAGLELHERSLLAAQRDDVSGEFTLQGRRAALKYGRLWRFLARRNAIKDARRGSAITSRVALLPLGLGTYRPPPLPLRSHEPSAPMWQTHERKYGEQESKEQSSSSSSSMFAPTPALSTLDAAAALFPRLPPANRPPPRRPLDLDAAFMPLPTPVLQLPIGEHFMPAPIPRTVAQSAVLHHPGVAGLGSFVSGPNAAASALPVSRELAHASAYLTPPSSSGLTSPTHAHGAGGATATGLSPLPASALGLAAQSRPAAATADAASSSTDVSSALESDCVVEQQVLALEEQLHRLLEWKADSKQRRQHLQHIEQRLAHAVGADRSSLLAEHHSLQIAVSTDAEHRPYWCEQVRLVQQRISAQIHAAQVDG